MSNDHNIERLDAATAFRRASANPYRSYPAPARDGTRLYPIADPVTRPSFAMTPQDSVFAIGSCFARNIERSLQAKGLQVLSRDFDLGEIGRNLSDPANLFNKYSIHSVLQELRWASDRSSFPGEALLLDLGQSGYFDGQLGMPRIEGTREAAVEFRRRYLDVFARAFDADVVVLTLGYVETWFDRQMGLYLNVVPPVQLQKRHPGRFEFRVLSYRDVLEGLKAVHELLTRARSKPLRMLITISPVPLLATFRDMDVLVANTYSKSVQRAAIDEFLLGCKGVDYFPSFEFVTLSEPSMAWVRSDYRHVDPLLVDRIMSSVLLRYMAGEGPALDPGALLSTVKLLARSGRHAECVEMLRAARALVDRDPDLLIAEAQALRRTGEHAAATERFKLAIRLADERPELERRIARLTERFLGARKHDRDADPA